MWLTITAAAIDELSASCRGRRKRRAIVGSNDRMRGETGPIFVRTELPQPTSATPTSLRPIVPLDAPDRAARIRQITPARLAIAAKASAGSGLIDLDEVARALLQAPPADVSPPVRERLVGPTRQPIPPVVAAADPPEAAKSRALVLMTVALLAALAAMLTFVATS